jgi:hypothetical protein
MLISVSQCWKVQRKPGLWQSMASCQRTQSRTLIESFLLYIHTVSDEGVKELADSVPAKICLVPALQLNPHLRVPLRHDF